MSYQPNIDYVKESTHASLNDIPETITVDDICYYRNIKELKSTTIGYIVVFNYRQIVHPCDHWRK